MMGFNKRYLREEDIRKVYLDGGYEHLVKYIRTPDAIIVEDEFSQKIVNMIVEGDSESRIKILMNNG